MKKSSMDAINVFPKLLVKQDFTGTAEKKSPVVNYLPWEVALELFEFVYLIPTITDTKLFYHF